MADPWRRRPAGSAREWIRASHFLPRWSSPSTTCTTEIARRPCACIARRCGRWGPRWTASCAIASRTGSSSWKGPAHREPKRENPGVNEMTRTTVDRREPARPRAFTLVELLVVVAILSLLMAILLPVVGKARVIAPRAACTGKLEQIALGYTMYLNESRGWFYGDNQNLQNPLSTYGGWPGKSLEVGLRTLNAYLGPPVQD